MRKTREPIDKTEPDEEILATQGKYEQKTQKTEIKIEPNTKDHHSLLDSEFVSELSRTRAVCSLQPKTSCSKCQCWMWKI